MPPRNEVEGGGGSLTAADIRLLREMMLEVAAETAARHICRFSMIPDAEAKEMGHAVGMLSDVGAGELRAGIEVVRENHKWTNKVRDRVEKVSLAASLSALGLVIAATIGALWVGIKQSLLK